MSSDDQPSAIDALVEGERELKEQVDQLAEQRDDADRRVQNLAAAVDDRDESWWDEYGESATNELAGRVEADIEVLRAERDAFLADSQRLAADFANYRKLADKRVAESAAAQSAALVRDLLPVLDACDSALEQDQESAVGPIRAALLGELEKNGLELIAPETSRAFDPEQHDAVQHEPADPDDEEREAEDGFVVSELLRAGYAWKGRVIRPAMVKVMG
jgi:molecular chaperone GrpE